MRAGQGAIHDGDEHVHQLRRGNVRVPLVAGHGVRRLLAGVIPSGGPADGVPGLHDGQVSEPVGTDQLPLLRGGAVRGPDRDEPVHGLQYGGVPHWNGLLRVPVVPGRPVSRRNRGQRLLPLPGGFEHAQHRPERVYLVRPGNISERYRENGVRWLRVRSLRLSVRTLDVPALRGGQVFQV